MIKIPPGPKDKVPEELYVFIEISKGTKLKYELNKELGVLVLDRVLYTSMVYPFNYGFIPSTLCEDGDPLDCLVITHYPLQPGTIIKVRPIGLLEMEDEEGKDEKLIAVPTKKIDPQYEKINDINDLPESLKNEIKHFFEHYKELEPGKWVKIREWKNKDFAIEFVKKAIENFEKQK